jgi:hypothetical protein
MPLELSSVLGWSLASGVGLIGVGDVATDITVMSSSEKREMTFIFLTWIPIR